MQKSSTRTTPWRSATRPHGAALRVRPIMKQEARKPGCMCSDRLCLTTSFRTSGKPNGHKQQWLKRAFQRLLPHLGRAEIMFSASVSDFVPTSEQLMLEQTACHVSRVFFPLRDAELEDHEAHQRKQHRHREHRTEGHIGGSQRGHVGERPTAVTVIATWPRHRKTKFWGCGGHLNPLVSKKRNVSNELAPCVSYKT